MLNSQGVAIAAPLRPRREALLPLLVAICVRTECCDICVDGQYSMDGSGNMTGNLCCSAGNLDPNLNNATGPCRDCWPATESITMATECDHCPLGKVDLDSDDFALCVSCSPVYGSQGSMGATGDAAVATLTVCASCPVEKVAHGSDACTAWSAGTSSAIFSVGDCGSSVVGYYSAAGAGGCQDCVVRNMHIFWILNRKLVLA